MVSKKKDLFWRIVLDLLLFTIGFGVGVSKMAWRDWVPNPIAQRLGVVQHLKANAKRDILEIVGEDQPMIIRPGEYAASIDNPSKTQPQGNQTQRPDTNLYGAVGTPIVSGFISELGEYNSDLRGRSAIPIFEKMRRSDADVAALLAAIKLPIRAAEYTMVPGAKDNEPDYKLAQELAKFAEDNLFGGLEYTNSLGMRFSQRFTEVIENALLCIDYGCSGYEDVWAIDGEYVRLQRMAQRLPLTFYRFHIEPDGETLKAVEQWGYRGNQFVNVAVPADKFVLFCFRREGANYYGRSALREVYPHWYWKTGLYRIDVIACERNGAGIPTVIMGPQSSLEDKKAANAWVNNLSIHQNTGMALPHGWELRLVATQGSEHKIMPSIEHHSRMICRAGLAMFMSLGSESSGNRALGNTMVDFFKMSEEAVAEMICEQMSETSIRRLIDYNFYRGPGKPLPYPKLKAASIQILDPQDLFNVFKELAAANVDIIQPDDETENYVRKKLGAPVKSKQVRPRYQPVTQRIETQTSESPEQIEQDKIAPATPEGTEDQNQGPDKTESSRGQAGPQSKVIEKQGQDKKPTSKPPSETPQVDEEEGKLPKTPVKKDTKKMRLAELKPHEKKHDFEGHVQRQDQTGTAVRRVLGGAKPTMIRDIARRAAQLGPKDLSSLTVPFNKQLQDRVAKSLRIAQQYGFDQVFAERYRATGRSKKDRVLLTSRALHQRLKWHGMDISIENTKGSMRQGTDRQGNPWATVFQYPYGYIRMRHSVRDPEDKGRSSTIGNDQEHIDCYVGPDDKAPNVYVVRQNDPDTGLYDEDKCMLNFTNEGAARDAYLDHHSRAEQAIGSIETMTVEDFMSALKTGKGRLIPKKAARMALADPSNASADEDKPGLIAEAAVSDMTNWLTSRAKGAHVDAYKQGYRGESLEQAMIRNLQEGSDAAMDKAADEASRSAVAGGRWDALLALASEIRKYVRTEAMDQNTCEPCQDGDGEQWDSLADVDWSPGDDCDGADACRGQLLPIFLDEGLVTI